MKFLIGLLSKLNVIGSVIIIVILIVFLISFIVNLLIKLRYISIKNDLDDRENRETGLFNEHLLNKIVEDYRNTAMGNYSGVNTQAIIEKCFNQHLKGLLLGERFVKHTVSILITLGLLGTFWGLTISVGELVNLFDFSVGSGVIDNFGDIADGLVYTLGGMAVAFLTSLFGIMCSILLVILTIIINIEESRETLMVNIEEYLDNSVALVVAKDKETEYTLMNKILRQTFIEFGEKIETTLKQTVEAYGEKLSHVVIDVELSSKALEGTVDKFDNSLKNFASNIKEFSQFNDNLRNNIEKMDVNFIRVTEALRDASEIIVQNYSAIENFSSDIRNSADEMTRYNRQVISDIGQLVDEVKTTVSSIKELGSLLDSNITERREEIRAYREQFALLMGQLGNEIKSLGGKAADAFSQSLEENRNVLSRKVVEGLETVMKEIFIMLDSFKENERALAKTIAMLPDQALTYNEAAAAKIDRQLNEIKEIFNRREID